MRETRPRASRSLCRLPSPHATLTITSSALSSGTQNTIYSADYKPLVAPHRTRGQSPRQPSRRAQPRGIDWSHLGKTNWSGNFSFGVTVKDAGSPAQTTAATATLSLVQAGASLAITTTSLPGGVPNKTYSATLNATGGTSPYTWSLTSGSLPNGLALAASTGIITGQPTTSSSASLTFKVTDSSSPLQTMSITLTLAVAPVALAITTSSLSSGVSGTTYSNLLQASGGTTPYTWSVSKGSLPAGLAWPLPQA